MEVRGRELHVGIQLQAQRTSWAQYVVALQAVEALGFEPRAEQLDGASRSDE